MITEPMLQVAREHARDLRRQAKYKALSRTEYPDGEKRPRILRHWANR